MKKRSLRLLAVLAACLCAASATHVGVLFSDLGLVRCEHLERLVRCARLSGQRRVLERDHRGFVVLFPGLYPEHLGRDAAGRPILLPGGSGRYSAHQRLLDVEQPGGYRCWWPWRASRSQNGYPAPDGAAGGNSAVHPNAQQRPRQTRNDETSRVCRLPTFPRALYRKGNVRRPSPLTRAAIARCRGPDRKGRRRSRACRALESAR